jgi:hypothetical protein
MTDERGNGGRALPRKLGAPFRRSLQHPSPSSGTRRGTCESTRGRNNRASAWRVCGLSERGKGEAARQDFTVLLRLSGYRTGVGSQSGPPAVRLSTGRLAYPLVLTLPAPRCGRQRPCREAFNRAACALCISTGSSLGGGRGRIEATHQANRERGPVGSPWPCGHRRATAWCRPGVPARRPLEYFLEIPLGISGGIGGAWALGQHRRGKRLDSYPRVQGGGNKVVHSPNTPPGRPDGR